jgi:hypothetical protein
MFSKKFDRRLYLALATLGFSLALGAAFGTYSLWPANLETGYQPSQPIEFSHALMAGKHQIDCLYCHATAEKGPHAGMPTVATCMKCHEQIQTKDAKGNLKPAIAALLEHWKQKKPIRWEKVYDLADFVYFDHSRHLAPGTGLDCVDCHGEVEKAERIQRIYSLKMGWCLDCHMQPPPEGSPAGQTTRAPISCTACHR